MKLLWITDPHLDHMDTAGHDRFIESVQAEQPHALLLTGDIAEGHTIRTFLAWLHGKLPCEIYFVLGNHDFYRSSVETVHAQIRVACERLPRLHFLPDDGVVVLDHAETTALVGVNGWADGRAGRGLNSRVVMCDWELIQDLRPHSLPVYRSHMLAKLEALARGDAAIAKQHLAKALRNYRHVYFACHVPPWPEAAWHNGKPSDPDWLPWFCSVTLGEAIQAVATDFPDSRVTVLCGHSHSAGSVKISPNVEAITGAAVYGQFVQTVIEL